MVVSSILSLIVGSYYTKLPKFSIQGPRIRVFSKVLSICFCLQLEDSRAKLDNA